MMVRGGDSSGMRELYSRYAGYLTAVCSRFIPDRDEVKDVLQDSFVKVFTNFDSFSFKGEGSLRAWVRKITVNESLKALRKDRRLTALPVNMVDMEDEEEEVPFGDVPQSVIQDMIRRLPDGYRTVFNLYVFENMKHKEIAELLGIKEDSSASQLLRAKAMLAREIKEYQRRKDNE